FGHFTALGVDSIHGLFDEWLHIVGAIAFAFVVHERAIAGVGEPDGAVVRMHHAIVRGIELFALIVLGGEDGDAAIVLVPAHVTRAVTEADLPTAVVKGIAVAVHGRRAEHPADVVVLFKVAQVLVAR